MRELDRMKLAIERGWIANTDTGEIVGERGFIIKNKNKAGYIICSVYINNKAYEFRGHRFVWYVKYGEIPIEQIDHINRIRDDNRIENLRSVSNKENSFNKNAKGYYWNKNNHKWISYIHINYEMIYLGSFDNEIDAYNSRLEAKLKYHKI